MALSGPMKAARFTMASDTNTPPEILDLFALDTDVSMRWVVAANPSASPETLEYLANDPHRVVRVAVELNPSVPSQVRERLASDPDLQIQSMRDRPSLLEGALDSLRAFDQAFSAEDLIKRESMSPGLSSNAERETPSNSAFIARALSLPDEEIDEASIGDAVPIAETVALLGGQTSLGRVIRSSDDLAGAVHAGLPTSVLEALRRAGFTSGELASLIAPARTLARRRTEQRLSIEESSAVERIARILVLADRALGSRETALAWLRRPQSIRFSGDAPIDRLRSDIGARTVEKVLLQAEFGIVS